MGDFLQKILDLLRELAPWTIIRTYEQGVRFRFGHDVAELGAGLFWRWPLVDEIHTVGITEQTKEFRVQSITLADGVPICFTVAVVYRVTSARQMYLQCMDLDLSIEIGSMIHLAKVVRGKTWEELRQPDEVKKLEQSLERRLTTKLNGWGTIITDLAIADLVQAKHYRLFGDPVQAHTARALTALP